MSFLFSVKPIDTSFERIRKTYSVRKSLKEKHTDVYIEKTNIKKEKRFEIIFTGKRNPHTPHPDYYVYQHFPLSRLLLSFREMLEKPFRRAV